METVHSMRIHDGNVQNANMSYSQRQPTHRPSHVPQTEFYKPSRSPLPNSATRYPYPASPQQLQAPPASQRYNVAQVFPYRDSRPPRISILHPDYGPRSRELIQQQQQPQPPPPQQQQSQQPPPPSHHIDQGQQPFKKIRLQDNSKDIQPLRIDTREQQGVYNPQVEAISPTLPDQLQHEDQLFRTTKDDLLQQIGKVDREIAKAESQISILKKKQQELEEAASKPSLKKEVEEDSQPKHQSLAQKIYAENRRRAQNAHAQLDSLGGKVDWPIYNQPSDTAVYHENKRKYVTFKKRLLEYFKKRHSEKEARNTYITETYSKMMQEWLKKVDKIESSYKRKVKEVKNREFFEKVFPELRRERENKERFNRVGARIKSEADLEEIMDNIEEQALEEKKMRSYAVIPPMLLDAKERKIVYQNNNGHITDMEAVYKSRQYLNVWTSNEKETFKEKFLQHSKNFGMIASYLDRKSVADCVQYYYLSKKTENYKQLLRKCRRTRSSRNNPQKVTNSQSIAAVILTTGVTTRLQREQQQKTGAAAQQQRPGGEVSDLSAKNSGASTPTTNTPPSTTTTTNCVASNGSGGCSTITSTGGTPPGTACDGSGGSKNDDDYANKSDGCGGDLTAATTTTTKTTDENMMEGSGSGGSNEQTSKECCGDSAAALANDNLASDASTTASTGGGGGGTGGTLNVNAPPATNIESKKKKERRKEVVGVDGTTTSSTAANLETTDDETNDAQGDKMAQGQCIVCGSQLGPQLHSRALAPSQASQYGLRDDQVPPNGRVCNTCRCKCVRSRYTHCPLPSCPNARGRVKRLRSFPQRLHDLPPEVRDPILAEFHVPNGVAKCCSACFNRIQRRLGPVEEWSEEEIAILRGALTELGANWQSIGERLNKAAHAVRSYYAANRKRLGLEQCLGDRKPTLTDEEESGSTTSSCEETLRERHSSDTASAESPPVHQEQPQNPTKKEDYDSSATETADEGQTPDHYQSSATITPVNNDGQPRQNTSPLTVKDLMLNVIELSLMKTPGGQPNIHPTPTSGTAPTISSILNSNDTNEVTIVSEYNLNNAAARQQRNDLNLAKLGPLIGATITPVPAPLQQQQQDQRGGNDDLVVMQSDAPENLTLDLSIKKPRDPPPPVVHSKPPPPMHRNDSPYNIYHQQERKSPAVYVASVPRVQQNKLPSPKLANPKAGSITLGTPIVNQPRYEGLLRQMPPEPKMGSITQGTPIHVPHLQDKRLYDYYNKRAPPQQAAPPPPPPQSSSAYAYRQPSFEQLSSRQIIMNDYITSQQMLGRRNEKPQYYPASSPHRTPPPPPPAPSSQQRQGVIQRHTPRPHYPPPGHEALNSLVDVAVQQPSLPVPSAHEGLGKTMADNLLEQPRRFQIMQRQQEQIRQQQQMQQQQQQMQHQQHRMEAERRYQQQQQQVQQQQAKAAQVARSESNTLTAASLIDAIITHQINQTAEGGREVVTNNREPQRASDRLFQSFHREQPGGGGVPVENNGEMSPSIINVDLDCESNSSKNLTVKELADTVISHDFSNRNSAAYYHMQDAEWKRRLSAQQQQQVPQQQQQQHKDMVDKQQQDERQIIRIAQQSVPVPQQQQQQQPAPPQQQQKYHIEPVSPPENHWPEQNFRRYQQAQSHISPLDYVKNRIVEVMRTEDDKKEQVMQQVQQQQQPVVQQDSIANSHDVVGGKERSDSPGDMVIDEEKHDEFAVAVPVVPPASNYSYPQYVQPHKDNPNEPKPLLSAQYESLSDED